MKASQDRYLRVGHINTRYWAEGSQGSQIVLLHGIGGHIESWQESFDALARQHRVYALDLLGHGRTDKPLDASYKTADLARFVKDFMAALGIERAHVVGHSLGGAIGTRLALLYPTAVDRLVLVASAGLGKEVILALRLCSVPLLGELLSRPSRSGSASFARSAVHDPAVITDESVELDYQLSMLPNAQKAFLRCVRANGNPLSGQGESMYGPNVRGLPTIRNPVLVVWGKQDQFIPVAHAEVAAKGLPDVRVHLLDDCGHCPMLEHPQVFNELLLEFLSD
jgi:pimeloyl-ACP methyl ester carboxylesterase